MQATQLPEPAAVPVQRPASPALAPALRTISGETPHYRARFEVAAADGADAAEAVKEIVMGWLHAKGLDVPEGAADIAVPAGWTAADEPDAAKAVRFLGLSGAQGAAWAVEADELDGEFSRRRWHTRIGLAPAGDGGCILNVQVSHYAVNGFFGYQRNPLPSVPRVVRDILANGKLDVRIGASRVSVEEIYLDADTLKRDFMSSLTDRARCLSIVLMTTDDDGKTPVWDATELASKLVGMATVYVIDMRDGALVQAFRDLLPDRTPAGRYRIGRSAVMVYRPGIDLSGEESLSACTLFTRHRIERYAAGGRDGFINVLMQGLGRGIDARPGDVAGIGDVLWLRSRVESERQVADEFQRRTGYELTFSESSATRARADLMKMRERSYGGRTVDISAHIKGRSQKNTFRLHFYIDRENELIVIGHAGCHMKTAGSHRRGFK